MEEWKWQRWSGLISIQGEHGREIEGETQRPVISLHIEITALFRVNNILWLPGRSVVHAGQGNHVSELLQDPVRRSVSLCLQGNIYWWSSCWIQISNHLERYHPFSHKAWLIFFFLLVHQWHTTKSHKKWTRMSSGQWPLDQWSI